VLDELAVWEPVEAERTEEVEEAGTAEAVEVWVNPGGVFCEVPWS